MDLTDVQNEGVVLSICYHFSFTAYKHACNLKAFSLRRDGEIYIPLAPPEARAAFHFALASFMKTAAKLCSFLRSFWLPFSAGKGVLSGKATSPLCPPRGTKGITH
jgi:hypothetical protein